MIMYKIMIMVEMDDAEGALKLLEENQDAIVDKESMKEVQGMPRLCASGAANASTP